MLGVAKNTVTGYERGNRAPDALKIKAIAKVLGVTGNWLMECEHTDELPPVVSDEALILARKYDALDLPGQSLVRLVVDHETERVKQGNGHVSPSVREALGEVSESQAAHPDLAQGE